MSSTTWNGVPWISIFLLSCEKDDATEHISKVTTYAVLDMKGEEWVVVPQGGTYTDAGAEAAECLVDGTRRR